MDGLNRNSVQHVSVAVDKLPVAAYVTNNEGYITHFNALATELWGRTPDAGEQWCGAFRLMDLQGETIDHRDCSLARFLRSEPQPVRTALLERPGGDVRAVRPHPSWIRDSQNRLVGCLNLLIDVTDDWRSAGHAGGRDELLAGILRADAIGLTVFDYRNLRTVRANDQFLKIIGATEEEFESKVIDCYLATPIEFRHLDDRAVSEAQSQGYWAPFEKEYERRDGQRVPVRVSSAPIPNFPGHCLVCVEDLTLPRKAEQEVSLLRAEVHHLSRLSAMGTMAAVLAHEVAQPFAAIKNALWVLENADPGEHHETDRADALRLIKKEANRGHQLVERMRHFSRPEKNSRERVDLRVLIDGVSSLTFLRRPDVKFSVKIGNGARFLFVDPIQIEQVLLNLLRNSAEALDGSGSIEVRSRSSETDIEISVIDDGPGFTEVQLEQAFKPFSSDKAGGTGLGLSICRSIVEAHGGAIEAHNCHVGACVRMTLPKYKRKPR